MLSEMFVEIQKINGKDNIALNVFFESITNLGFDGNEQFHPLAWILNALIMLYSK